MPKPRYLNRLEQIPQLSEREVKVLKPIVDKFVFRTNEYYQSLIDWDDPDDPIRRIIMPDSFEMSAWGELDASGEADYTVAEGCQHKYHDTALLLVNDVCGGYCRFCFRKRLFMDDNDETSRDVSAGIEYIRSHTEITNVLLTGGDPLLLSNRRLNEIFTQIREIDHVSIIRIGSKMPAFNPFRITEDPGLLEVLDQHSTPAKPIYIMAHFNHPRELSDHAVKAIRLLQRASVFVCNQTPLLRGINDDPVVLTELLDRASFAGATPYYLFQCRPTEGNYTYSVPVENSLEIVDAARAKCSGLAARVRFVMSHNTGKIEICGMDNKRIYFKYHRTPYPQFASYFFACRRNPDAHWMDDYDDFSVGEAIAAVDHRAVNK